MDCNFGSCVDQARPKQSLSSSEGSVDCNDVKMDGGEAEPESLSSSEGSVDCNRNLRLVHSAGRAVALLFGGERGLQLMTKK